MPTKYSYKMRELLVETYAAGTAGGEYQLFSYSSRGWSSATEAALRARGFVREGAPVLTEEGVRCAAEIYARIQEEDTRAADRDAFDSGLPAQTIAVHSSAGVGAPCVIDDVERFDSIGLRPYGGTLTRAVVRKALGPQAPVERVRLEELRPYPQLRAVRGAEAFEVSVVDGSSAWERVAWEASVDPHGMQRTRRTLVGVSQWRSYWERVQERLAVEGWDHIDTSCAVVDLHSGDAKHRVLWRYSGAAWSVIVAEGTRVVKVLDAGSSRTAHRHLLGLIDDYRMRGWDALLLRR